MNKNALTLLFLVPIFCVIGAIIMALNDKEGWGWLLLVAIIFAPSSKNGGDDDESEEE